MKKKHGKGSFERHGYDPRQSFPHKSHILIVNGVRDWPQGCGNFIFWVPHRFYILEKLL